MPATARSSDGEEREEDGAHQNQLRMPNTNCTRRGTFALLPGEARGLPEAPDIGDADIGCEFPADLVAQPQPGIDIGETGADATAGIGLAVEIHLDFRLQDEALRDEKIVGRGEAKGGMTAIAEIGGRLVVKEKRGEALHAERRPGAAGAGIPVGAHARLEIDIGRDRAIVEELVAAVFDAAFAKGEAFGFEPELVVVGADPGLAFPTEGVLAAADAALGLIEERVGEDLVVHDGRHGRALSMPGIVICSFGSLDVCAAAMPAMPSRKEAERMMRAVLMTHAPRGTCPSPCDREDGSDRPTCPARRR